MDEQQLQRLGDILFERLMCGEDSISLQAQLSAKLGPADAERLIADVRRRVEDEDANGTLEETAAAIRHRRARRGGYWRGAIVSREQAERIARLTAYWIGGLGALVSVGALASGRPDPSAFITGLLLVVPAAALWKTKSVIAAGVLLGIAGLACLGTVVAAVYEIGTAAGFGGFFLIPVLIWIIPLLATLRAFRATRFLQRNAGQSVLAEVFD